MLRVLSCLVSLLVAPAAWAHPHVFVDVGLRLVADDDGKVTAIEVTWTYDLLFTLLVLSDRDLDQDADGQLTQAERAALMGFDLEDWPEDFDGALFVYQDQQPVRLKSAEPVNLWIDDQGRLVTRHRRALEQVDVRDGLQVLPYDPYYYAALRLGKELDLPDGCEGAIIRPDTKAADARVAELGWTGTEEALFDQIRVGIHYAETLEVTCAGS